MLLIFNISRPAEYLTACHTVLVEEIQQGRNSCLRLQFGFQLGLHRVVAPLSCLRSISLASLFLVFLFLPDLIFYRSYVDGQHFCLRSFASLCTTYSLARALLNLPLAAR